MDTTKLVGMTEEEALALVKEAGFRFRVRRRDGESFIGTMDYRRDRVNVVVENGKVVSARIG